MGQRRSRQPPRVFLQNHNPAIRPHADLRLRQAGPHGERPAVQVPGAAEDFAPEQQKIRVAEVVAQEEDCIALQGALHLVEHGFAATVAPQVEVVVFGDNEALHVGQRVAVELDEQRAIREGDVELAILPHDLDGDARRVEGALEQGVVGGGDERSDAVLTREIYHAPVEGLRLRALELLAQKDGELPPPAAAPDLLRDAGQGRAGIQAVTRCERPRHLRAGGDAGDRLGQVRAQEEGERAAL